MGNRKSPYQQCLHESRQDAPSHPGLIKPSSQMPAINIKNISYSIWASVLITVIATCCDSESI